MLLQLFSEEKEDVLPEKIKAFEQELEKYMEQSGNLIVAKQSRAEYDFVLKGTGQQSLAETTEQVKSLLAEYFLQRYARKYQKEMRGLTREAKNKLLKYAWPGNVRELQHTVERAVILGDGSLLRPENFMFQASVSRQKKEEEVLNLEQLERQAVERAMRLSEGNVTRAAEYLGITRFALYRKLEKLGL